jgi:signal peptidase I
MDHTPTGPRSDVPAEPWWPGRATRRSTWPKDLDLSQPGPDNASATGDEVGWPPAGLIPSATAAAAAATTAHEQVVAAQPPGTWSQVASEIIAWLKTLTSAAVYATLIVTFGFQVARVEGQSMAPTLQDQDRLIVNKLAYRLHDPEVGDIVMLYYPLDPSKSFVKRVVAEPNDSIRSVDGRVYRNDVPLPDDFIPPAFRSHDDWGPNIVPQGYYFVMGDHRNNSSDSRSWSYVPKKYIIGKVELRWWPLTRARLFESWK